MRSTQKVGEGEPTSSQGLKIFIGSSSEAAREQGPLDKVAGWLSEAKHTILRWNSNETFPLGSATWDELVKKTEDVDAAVFIFAGEDKTWFRGKQKFTQRDNVLLEYGLFFGSFSSQDKQPTKRAVIVKANSAGKIPTDLNVIYADFKDQENCRIAIKKWARDISKYIYESEFSLQEIEDIKQKLASVIKMAGYVDQDVSTMRLSKNNGDGIDIMRIMMKYDERLGKSDEFKSIKRDFIKLLTRSRA